MCESESVQLYIAARFLSSGEQSLLILPKSVIFGELPSLLIEL